MSVSGVVSDHERVRDFLDYLGERVEGTVKAVSVERSGIQRWDIETDGNRLGVLWVYGNSEKPTTFQYAGSVPGYVHDDAVVLDEDTPRKSDWVRLTLSAEYATPAPHWSKKEDTARDISSWKRRDKHESIPFGNN